MIPSTPFQTPNVCPPLPVIHSTQNDPSSASLSCCMTIFQALPSVRVLLMPPQTTCHVDIHVVRWHGPVDKPYQGEPTQPT
mmetsp:Transcript_20351/g.28612  ORF Transcript_20351/g.28612 Transcript_20351/m.28612 type:complete len:81 (-) Transcript_20351:3813-4055(-)